MGDDQRDAIAFLGDPASYEPGIGQVETIETHASLVFLAGNYAYKLKRAVKLPYLDFSTVDLRRNACAAELALNRRTAPSLYLELRALARNAAGRIGFSEKSPIDWVVVMRRFGQNLVFGALAGSGGLTAPIMDDLADHIAAFHAAADQRPDFGGVAAMTEIAGINHHCLAAARRAGFAAERIAGIDDKWRRELAALGPLIETRRRDGKVRRCHGDLHLRNICLIEGKPILFDCLEFSEALASIDILYDLAFLLMDLDHRGLGGFANRVLNRYLDRAGEEDGLAALPLFLSLRAGVRAHVTATALDEGAEVVAAAGDAAEMAGEARRYLDLAHDTLEPAPPRLIAIGGLSGSGKSTLAAALAPKLGRRPGARVLRSDVIRKLLLGVEPETRLPESAYAPQTSAQVYETLRQKARAALGAGYAAVIDAVSLLPEERRAFAEIAAAARVPFTGLWLEAAPAAMAERLAGRRRDASDASAAVLEGQLARDPGPIAWTRIAAGGDPRQSLTAARAALARG